MKKNDWQIIFCSHCNEPTPPLCGILTDHIGFICDDCLLNETEIVDEPARDTRLR